VYPRSRTVDRFNDLFARNRFTSACSSLIVRVPGFSPGEAQLGFICEPVHNLVARIELQAEGGSFSAIRHPDDDRYDFLTSSDLWSRPVRIINAPDGTLWVLDMVRQVIEHPQWIPTAWQERLDLRSGEALGRIYRIRYQGWKDRALPRIELNRQSLVNALRDENGVVRDLALQAMVQANSSELPAQLEDDVREIARDRGLAAAVQISGLGCLTGMNWLSPADVVWALQSDDGRVVRYGLEIVERLTAQRSTPELQAVFDSVAQRQLGASVDLQWVLTASLLPGFADSHGFIDITARSGGNRWIYRALSLVQDSTLAKAIMNQMLDTADREEAGDRQDFAELENSMARLWESCTPEHRVELADARLNALLQQTSIRFQPSQLLMLSVLATHGGKHLPSHTQDALTQVASRARQRLAAADGASAEGIRVREQLSLVNLLGIGLTDIDEEVQLAGLLLDSERETQVKQAVIQRLQKMSSPAVAEVLIQRWPQFNSALRSTTATTLLSRPGWALAFVGALESEAIRVAELDMSTVQQLTGYRDREIRARCLLIFGQPSQRSHVVARYLSEMPAPKADESLGEQPGFKLFAEHCATCHQSAEGRPLLGPPLENLNHWTIEQWLTAILDPNQALEHKYRLHSIVTSDGQVVIGILLGKDVKATTLGCSDGSIRTIAVNEIESMKEMGNSLMPEGFEQKLSPKQLSQLLGFLRNR
jgi:putative heme-binding domain-containing protein